MFNMSLKAIKKEIKEIMILFHIEKRSKPAKVKVINKNNIINKTLIKQNSSKSQTLEWINSNGN